MELLHNELDLPTSSFSCGPGQGLAAVRTAPLYKTLFERSHRAADLSYEGLYKEAEQNLRALLNVPADYTVLFFPGGATSAMDAVLWSLTDDSVSGLDMGAFSHLWCEDLAARLPQKIQKHFLKTFFPKQPNLTDSLVILTPNETSTGVQLPDDFLITAAQIP